MDAKSLQLLADGHTTKTRPSTLPASAYIGTWKGHGLVREGSIESSGIGLIAAFWLLFWRMALRVFVLLTVLGTTYGFLVGGLFPYGIGLMISGPIFGAIAGLGLGVLEGLVLGVVAVLVHRGGAPADFMWYRRKAELACVVACILAV